MNEQLERAQKRMGEFLHNLKDNGYTVVLVGSVGAIPAIAASLSLWKVIEPHWNCIDSIRTASGSGIPMSLAASGVPASAIQERLTKLKLEDIVEDIGFFVEHTSAKGFFEKSRKIKNYYFSGLRGAFSIIKHLTDERIGIVKGDKIRTLLSENLCSDLFADMNPPFEVVATLLNSRANLSVFSRDTTPNVPVSNAVVASCAVRHIFAIQIIDGKKFIDAAQKESIPLLSVIDSHVAKGRNPKKLFIIGTFVHTLPLEELTAFHFLRLEHYYPGNEHVDMFRKDLALARYTGAKTMIFELNAAGVALPSFNPFPEFPVFGKSFQEIRKAVAKFLQAEFLEKLLRGTSLYIYNELNMQHLPYYFDDFEAKLYEKIERRLNQDLV